MSVINWVKGNMDKVAKYAGGAVIVGGIVGENLITGEYNPSRWIGPGAIIYGAGDAIDFYKTCAREKLDKGTKIKLAGKAAKTASAEALGVANFLNPDPTLQQILIEIGGSAGLYGTLGFWLERKGQKIKEKISPYFKSSKELGDVAESLENEKKPMSRKELKERLQKIEENLPHS